MKRKNEGSGFFKSRKAMALPMTLVVMLIAGVMVGVSMYFIENMMTTTKMKTDDELRLNAVLAGVEIGKELIIQSFVNENYIPRREDFNTLVTSNDIDTADSRFTFLVANDKSNSALQRTGIMIDNVSVDVYVYDLAYETASGVIFFEGMPPRMRDIWDPSAQEGQSIIQGQSYASSNRGGGSSSSGTSDFENGFYLVRSIASLNNISKTVEQAVRLRQ